MLLHPERPRGTANSGVSWGSFIAKCNQIPTPAFLEARRPQFNPRYMKKSLVIGLFFRFILTKALFKHIVEHQMIQVKVLYLVLCEILLWHHWKDQWLHACTRVNKRNHTHSLINSWSHNKVLEFGRTKTRTEAAKFAVTGCRGGYTHSHAQLSLVTSCSSQKTRMHLVNPGDISDCRNMVTPYRCPFW